MKIGIITHYHTSINCGGVLQAYALCKFMKKLGTNTEQITYQMDFRKLSFSTRLKRWVNMEPMEIVRKILYLTGIKKADNKVQEEELSVRRGAFWNFTYELIPHSKKIYTQYNIHECIDDYDVFITGSDQVWNLTGYDSNYFLDFVDGTKKRKFSYAASISMKELSNMQKAIFKKSLEDYEAVSVREQDAVVLLDGLIENTINYVVDPTLLLGREEWDEVCAEQVVKDKYVFGYFLGTNIGVVHMAKAFANKYGMKFVMIPFASGKYTMNEDDLMDIRILDASPEKFLSLVKHAEYVFTDSFHAVVFSFIYKKQFFVFNRDTRGTMNSRIYNVIELFEMENRFCSNHEQEKLEYVENLSEINYAREFAKLAKVRDESKKFIERIIDLE